MTTETLNIEAEVPELEAIAPVAEEAAAETAEKGEGEADEEGQPRDEAGKFKKDGVQRRFDELTRARREAEREAEYWRGVATRTAQSGAAEKPAKDDFADPDDYTEAVARWSAEQAVHGVQQKQAQDAADNARMATWKAREAETVQILPDYNAVVSGNTTPVAPHVVEALLDSDHGPALVYHIAKNPDVAERLNAMTPARAAIELGRLEATVTAPPVKKPSNAPPPVQPVSSAPSLGRSPEKMTTAEYMAWRRKELYGA